LDTAEKKKSNSAITIGLSLAAALKAISLTGIERARL
jgi:hypothetical protein